MKRLLFLCVLLSSWPCAFDLADAQDDVSPLQRDLGGNARFKAASVDMLADVSDASSPTSLLALVPELLDVRFAEPRVPFLSHVPFFPPQWQLALESCRGPPAA